MYIYPIITYYITTVEVWAPFICKSKWDKIEAVQNTGLRIILGLPKIIKNYVLLYTAGFYTIKEKIKSNAASLFFNISTSQYKHPREIERNVFPTPAPKRQMRPRPFRWANK